VSQSTVANGAALRLSPLAGRGRSASAIRVRGSLREGGDDRFENADQIARNVVIPEPQDPIVAVGRPFISHCVVHTVGVLTTFHFNDQASFAANEVDGVRPDRLLPDEFVTVQPAGAQSLPEFSFRVRQRGSQASCAPGLGLIGTAHAEAPPHPPRVTRVGLSPQAGRGEG
jgi:hypothetical protein